MVAEENGSSLQWFHFFDDISRLMVSERVDRQAHGILKVCSNGNVSPFAKKTILIS